MFRATSSFVLNNGLVEAPYWGIVHIYWMVTCTNMRASFLSPALNHPTAGTYDFNPPSSPAERFEPRRNFTFTMPVTQTRGHRPRLFLQRIRYYYRQGVAEILEFVKANKTTYGKPNVIKTDVPQTNMAKPNVQESIPPFHPAQEEVESVKRHPSQEPHPSQDESVPKGPLLVLNPDPPSPEESTNPGTWAGSRWSWQKEARATSPNIPILAGVNTMIHSRSATSISSSSLANSHGVYELEDFAPATSGVRLRTNQEYNVQPSRRVGNARSTGYDGIEVECKRWSLYSLLAEIV